MRPERSSFTYRAFIQKSIVEFSKVFLGVFGIEVLEEVSMKVAQLKD